MNYQDRLVAFIDILGFRNLVSDTIDGKGAEDTKKIKALYDAYVAIQENWKDIEDLSGSKQVTIFSDSIVIR